MEYKSDAGNLNLYFTGNNNNYLDYKAFAPKGVVYESNHWGASNAIWPWRAKDAWSKCKK